MADVKNQGKIKVLNKDKSAANYQSAKQKMKLGLHSQQFFLE